MNNERAFEGGCLCGALRWRATGEPLYAYHCHCRMCQKQSGAAFVTGVTFSTDAVRWTRGKPRLFQSSENASRGFCSHCGSSVCWQFQDRKTSFWAGSFDHPEVISVDWHVYTESQLPWLRVDDELPRHQRYPPDLRSQDPGG